MYIIPFNILLKIPEIEHGQDEVVAILVDLAGEVVALDVGVHVRDEGLEGGDGHGSEVLGHEGGDAVEEPPDLAEGVAPPAGDEVLPRLAEGDKDQGALRKPTLNDGQKLETGK